MVVLETAAIVAMVGWAASPTINRLIGKVQSYTAKKYKWYKDLEENLESVDHFLVEMRSTVRVVEARRTDDPNMECWLSLLKDAIDDMDDFFDILDYEIIDKSNKFSSDDSSSSSSAAAESEFGARTIGSDESSDMLRTLLKKLDDIRQSSRGLVQASMLAATVAGCSDSRYSSTSSGRPVTGALLPQEEEPLGYSDQYKKLIAWLLPDLEKLKEEDGSCNNDRSVVGIIGHGGMGKTTLAQKACNDPDVKSRFQLVIWAWVYNKFDEANLLGEIWRSAAAEAVPAARHSDMSFSSMQLALEKLVASKRYLLVLDDVCNDETATDLQRRQTWRNVLAPFQRGEGGSRVLLTTRAIICAQTVGADRSRRIYLDGIDRDSFVCLLKRTAAIGTHAPLVEEVLTSSALFSNSSSALASEWKLSPLSAKEMGLKLRNTSIKKRWEDILRTDCHENVISSHVSCYQQLPPHLQYCFAFVSLFPNGFKFHAEMLVKMWVAHGFISEGDDGSEDGNTMEDTASGYFNDLVSRSFFQEIKNKQDRRVTHYMIHEQIHSMIRSVSANYFLMVHGNTNTFAAAAKSIPHTVRHLSVTNGCLGCLLVRLKKHTSVLKRLRTLLVLRDSSGPAKPCAACARRSSKKEKGSSAAPASLLTAIGKDLLSEQSGIRVLDLTGTNIAELPPEIGNLIHLRYLVLPDTLIKDLSEQVKKLLHLQVLVRSTDAQTAAVVDDDSKKFNQPSTFCANEAGLSQLAGMNSLRGELSITGLGAVSNKKDAIRAKLRKKKFVKSLNLEWDKNESGETSPQRHQDVLEGLQPHFGIRKLQIRRYHGISSPSWLLNNCLEQLTHLQLINCRKWVTLPAFGHLPRLNDIHIREMNSVIQIDGSGPFKSLETLELSDMQSLVQWTAGATDSEFTILKKMEIKDCPELQILPPILKKTMDGRVIKGCPKLL